MAIPEDASRYGYDFAQQRLGFFEASQVNKASRVVVGFYQRCWIFLAIEPHACRVYISLQT